MKIKIYKSVARGKMCAPPSKSMAHRLLICAGLSGNGARITNVAFSKDIDATLRCLSAMGAEYLIDGNTVIFEKGVTFGKERKVLNCNESGSTLRFFIPLALIDGKETVFSGQGRLMERPMTIYRDICLNQNILFRQDERITVKGILKGGKYTVPGDVSSQFITGLMFALPLLGGGEIEITGKIESRSYINLTISAMDKSGISVNWKNRNTIDVPMGVYSMKNETVEGDYSNAAFLDGLSFLGGNVEVTGLDEDSMQGDAVYKEFYKKMTKEPTVIDLTDCPDLGPVLMALGYVNGVTLQNTARLKIKESDRGEAMQDVLSRFGITAHVFENEIIVEKSSPQIPTSPIYCYNDHRIVMSAALLLTITGGELDGYEAVSKSYPDFFDKLEELGIKLEYTN